MSSFNISSSLQFFKEWTPTKMVNELSTFRSIMNDIARNFNKITLYGICNGESVYLHNDDVHNLLDQIDEWYDLMVDSGLGGIKKCKHNAKILAHIILRLKYYDAAPDAKTAIETKIKAVTNCKSLQDFIESIYCID